MGIRVLVIDASVWVRGGVKAALAAEKDIEIVGEAANSAEGIDQAVALAPNVVVIDVTVDGSHGVGTIRAIKERCPQTHVLLFTPHASLELFRKAVAAGAIGCIVKDVSPAELAAAIRTVALGKTVLHQSIAIQVVEGLARGRGMPARHGLKDREIAILHEITKGLSDKEIAAKLFVSESTVKSTLRGIYQKLKIRNRAQAAAFMIGYDMFKE
jgi:DNA-binding NarL/FixJ family response regulator